jgi:hypothetical protein
MGAVSGLLKGFHHYLLVCEEALCVVKSGKVARSAHFTD